MSRAGPRRSSRALSGTNYAEPPSDEDDEEMLESEEAELDEEDEVSDENEVMKASRRPLRVESEELTDDDELSDESSTAPPPPSKGKGKAKATVPVRLKLKLPQTVMSSSEGPAFDDKPGPSRPRRVPIRARRIVEDENESSELEEEQDDSMALSEESEEIVKALPVKRLTERQAAIASGANLSLEDNLPPTRTVKKKQLNETELALRREETARKRKNLSEKKLEDEKAETINRLLKRQIRPRGGKRGGMASRTAVTPHIMDSDEEAEADETPTPPPPTQVPTMYRWISSSKGPAADAMAVDGEVAAPSMSFAFAIPPYLVQDVSTVPLRPTAKAVCAVTGCGAARKYRLVRNFDVGACGMPHLKQLEAM
ncbi:hypothetical protein CYLTODRAFT_385968 [Cylindrobasidium torrendii FP15055 ss-10]|uniref:INO80 complex subunit B-like conserved region domain-containing protein n=1 Tax=Cylindrobasidium torrendii FP15055 ss-10 TaxID=1314674 RepID=A0A0D7BU08_9AGAR|nr:hypothetical protein CYLTODRAFT_385968 [Cylindrobasidium torrendii FP15055 ss-10]